MDGEARPETVSWIAVWMGFRRQTFLDERDFPGEVVGIFRQKYC